ncbi:MAG: hypothetical protein NDI84_00925, partial [Steroidobacteraceae bacterium]|nr:hypothetical protein [Steroidobacteraceae bacterium]
MLRTITLVVTALAGLATAVADPVGVPSGEPTARIDLQTAAGVALVQGAWRYSDVEIVPAAHRAPDADGQPTGATVRTWTIRPQAGEARFDDSAWLVVDPTTLRERRGFGRTSFNWYRIAITVPATVDGVDTRGSTLVFETSLDDYA